ncbi:MAG: ABC transporter substrate-binding protein, partial [Deltaproteobacteria bacterium]
VYAPSALVRKPVLESYPKIKDILEPIFATLDRATLQTLNAKIQVEGRDARKVAAEYLKDKGLIK